MPPLIRIKVILDNKLEIFGIYDSGSNVSLINSRLLKLKDKETNDSRKTNLRTINGVRKTNGMIRLKTQIFDIEKAINVFVIDKENFDHDFLIGLDCIKIFYLVQNENLEITQKIPLTETYNKEEKKGLHDKQKLSKETVDSITGDEISDCSDGTVEGINRFERKYLVNFNEHVEERNFDLRINHLEYEQKSEINKLIIDHKYIFAKDKYDIGTVTDYEAHIDLAIDKYCCKRPYRCTIEDKKEIEEQVANLLEKNLIEESYSPFAAPVTLGAFFYSAVGYIRLLLDVL